MLVSKLAATRDMKVSPGQVKTGRSTLQGPPVTLADQVTFATGSLPQSVAVGDVNGDDKPDLVAVNASDATVSVLVNTTTAGSATPSFATGAAPRSIVLADINADDKLDLVGVNSGDDNAFVLLNQT